MKEQFAGITPSGRKVHRCLSVYNSFCNSTFRHFVRGKDASFTPFKGTIRRELLCKKCWGNNPSIKELREFGIEIKSEIETQKITSETEPPKITSEIETPKNIFSRLLNLFKPGLRSEKLEK